MALRLRSHRHLGKGSYLDMVRVFQDLIEKAYWSGFQDGAVCASITLLILLAVSKK